jgi:hypothetical protein
MRDSEKPLKVISGIVSGLLVVSALVFFILASSDPKVAEAVLEYSAPPGFNPAELAGELDRLRKDQGILAVIAIRSKLTNLSDPELAKIVSDLGSRLSFEADMKAPAISIRFTHRNAATAIAVANAAAEVVKESLENLQRKLATEILVQEDELEDRRKLLARALREDAEGVPDPPWGRRQTSTDAKADYEQTLRRLEELKAKPIFSLGSIRPATLTGE